MYLSYRQPRSDAQILRIIVFSSPKTSSSEWKVHLKGAVLLYSLWAFISMSCYFKLHHTSEWIISCFVLDFNDMSGQKKTVELSSEAFNIRYFTKNLKYDLGSWWFWALCGYITALVCIPIHYAEIPWASVAQSLSLASWVWTTSSPVLSLLAEESGPAPLSVLPIPTCCNRGSITIDPTSTSVFCTPHPALEDRT